MRYVLNVVNTPYAEFEVDIEFIDYDHMMRWIETHYTDWTSLVMTALKPKNGKDIVDTRGIRGSRGIVL